MSGVLHLAAGGIGFVSLAAAFGVLAAWFARRNYTGMAVGTRVAAAAVVVTFIVGAATATSTVGIVLLWLAVLVSWTWLAVASIAIYRTVPHPDADRRAMLL